jgi:mono/diheme cytochrome c family protein
VRSGHGAPRVHDPMRRILWIALLAAAAAWGASRFVFFPPRITPAERGRRLAEREGCFACHGPGGTKGVANPGRAEGSVPSYLGALMMYARDREEIREWIRDGATEAKRKSRSWREARAKGALKMPAFGSRLSPSQIDDLVAFIEVTSGRPEPPEGGPARGLERVQELGCDGCHGPGGRFARPNPGSLKGYVPPWDGGDFPELVRSRAEFAEWVEHGVARRLESNPFARFFLDRAPLRMPAYRSHLEAGDVDTLWAYVQWLRRQGTAATGDKG